MSFILTAKPSDHKILFEWVEELTRMGAIERLRGFETAWQVKNKDFFLRPLSSTFHGRDVFAPVAARLSLGVEASTSHTDTTYCEKK